MLWLGTIAGLFRFDGVRFVRYPEAGDEPLPSTHIRALVAAPDGGLWVGFLQGGISYIRDGHVTSYGLAEGVGPAAMQFGWDHDGVLWAVVSAGAVRFRDHHWELVARIEHARGLSEDRAGRIWIATTDHVLVNDPGANGFRTVADVKFPYNTLSYIAASAQGDIWSLLPGGTLRHLGPESGASEAGRLTVPAEGRAPHVIDRHLQIMLMDATDRAVKLRILDAVFDDDISAGCRSGGIGFEKGAIPLDLGARLLS
jgi:ligand-binding sensor domain-containing protein